MFASMNRLKLLIAISSISILSIGGVDAKTRQTRQEYIALYKHIAIEHMEKYGIPASITMAQGILESSCGNSQLASKSNNHFGIKCGSKWSGGKVYHDDDAKNECFRAYRKVEDSYEDHAIFLDSSPRYDALFSYSSSDYKKWAHGLKSAGYATAPHYASMLIKIIEEEKLYLLDKKKGSELYAKRHETEGGTSATATTPQVESTQSIDPNNFGVTINAHKGYNIERTNGVFFTRAKNGDSIESIAETFDISKHNLRNFNDLTNKSTINEGDIIFIERKNTAWQDDDKRSHQVSSGESLHSLSQKYGIRLRSLRKLNNMKRKDTLTEGQILKLK